MASRVLQAGSSILLKDIKSAGKERLKEINQNARTKKKSRVEEKLAEVEKSIKEAECAP
jgi:vacuolar-type H+-ATPase subunit E/Vma4